MLEIALSLGIPLVLIGYLTMLRAIASGVAGSLGTVQDAALDIAFLGMGAVGSTIYNPKVRQLLGGNTAWWVVSLLFTDFGVTILLVYLRKFYPAINRKTAFWNVVLGAFL